MNQKMTIAGIVFTGVLTLVGCVLVVGGVWFAFSTLQPAGAAVATPVDSSGAFLGTPAPGAPRIGAQSPDFTLKSLDGQTVSLGSFRGKVVLLNFWATWCGPCVAEMPIIEEIYKDISQEQVAILAINQGEFEDQVKGYTDIYHLHFPILLDGNGKVGDLFRVQALPTTFFLDRKGVIREIHIGGPMSKDYVKAQIQSLMKETN